MADDLDFTEDLTIDEFALDEAWVEHVNLYVKYANLASEAKRDCDLAKEKLEHVKAQLSLDIRDNPKKFGLEKITEGTISAVIEIEPDHIEANRAFIKTKYRQDVLMNAVRAME